MCHGGYAGMWSVARKSHLYGDLSVSALLWAKMRVRHLLTLEDCERRAIIKIATTLLAQLVAGFAAPFRGFAD